MYVLGLTSASIGGGKPIQTRLLMCWQTDTFDMYANTLCEYHQAKQIRLPEIGPVSAGGANKTSKLPHRIALDFAQNQVPLFMACGDSDYRLGS